MGAGRIHVKLTCFNSFFLRADYYLSLNVVLLFHCTTSLELLSVLLLNDLSIKQASVEMKFAPDAQKLVDYYSTKTLKIDGVAIKVFFSGEYNTLM